MRKLVFTIALVLSCSFAKAQTAPPAQWVDPADLNKIYSSKAACGEDCVNKVVAGVVINTETHDWNGSSWVLNATKKAAYDAQQTETANRLSRLSTLRDNAKTCLTVLKDTGATLNQVRLCTLTTLRLLIYDQIQSNE